MELPHLIWDGWGGPRRTILVLGQEGADPWLPEQVYHDLGEPVPAADAAMYANGPLGLEVSVAAGLTLLYEIRTFGGRHAAVLVAITCTTPKIIVMSGMRIGMPVAAARDAAGEQPEFETATHGRRNLYYRHPSYRHGMPRPAFGREMGVAVNTDDAPEQRVSMATAGYADILGRMKRMP